MKITIDPNIPDMTDEEIEDMKAAKIKQAEDDPEEFKRQMLGVTQVRMSEQVAQQLAEAGISLDEIVAMLLKKSGTSN